MSEKITKFTNKVSPLIEGQVPDFIQADHPIFVDFVKDYHAKGIHYVICTDISKDGMLQGASNELYKEIMSITNVKLIASGGVSCFNDLIELQEIGCEGVIVGKAFYEGKITLAELQKIC